MPRLPTPQADDGVWGTILNEFLLVEHEPDGSLKIRTDGTLSDFVSTEGSQIVAGVKTFTSSPIVPTPTTDNQAATKQYVDDTAISGAPDATTSSKGIVQLAGDLTGVAESPAIADGAITDAKVSASAGIAQSKVANLTDDLAGKADDSDVVKLSGGNLAEITDPQLANGFLRVNLDYAHEPTTPDSLAFYFNGTRTGYHNEKGELRARPAANNSVPFRVQQRSAGQTANLTEWTTAGNDPLAWVDPDGFISAPNVDRKVSFGVDAPDSPREGDLWIVP